jgi:hypothetical protein
MAQRPIIGIRPVYYNKEDKRIFPPKRMAGWMDCQFRKSYFSSRISNCINHYNRVSFSPQKISYTTTTTLFNGDKF